MVGSRPPAQKIVSVTLRPWSDGAGLLTAGGQPLATHARFGTMVTWHCPPAWDGSSPPKVRVWPRSMQTGLSRRLTSCRRVIVRCRKRKLKKEQGHLTRAATGLITAHFGGQRQRLLTFLLVSKAHGHGHGHTSLQFIDATSTMQPGSRACTSSMPCQPAKPGLKFVWCCSEACLPNSHARP